MKTDYLTRQQAITASQQQVTAALCDALQLTEVQGPLLAEPHTGVQDTLSGTERAASVHVPTLSRKLEVVHSLAKWKRQTLARYDFQPGEGILVHMQALRPDEAKLSPLHSICVDQWDWEQVIHPRARTAHTLHDAAHTIFQVLQETLDNLRADARFQNLALPQLPQQLTCLTTEELRQRYPDHTPATREHLITQAYGAVFLQGIGGPLSDGQPHDARAPDYDDWALNGDLLVWHEGLQQAVELSSMGIRVMPEQLREQSAASGRLASLSQPWHQALLAGELPATIGGGIGRSRLTMWLLQQRHIGQVQVSIWPHETYAEYPGLLR